MDPLHLDPSLEFQQLQMLRAVDGASYEQLREAYEQVVKHLFCFRQTVNTVLRDEVRSDLLDRSH